MIDEMIKEVAPYASAFSLHKELSGMVRKKVENEIKAVVATNIKPKIGSVLYCNLAFLVEHTGIYVGSGKVVHLDGDGKIEKVSFDKFVGRLEGANPAIAICCPVDIRNKPIGDKVVAERALSLVGKRRNYNLLFDNCHMFTYYCLTGKSLQVGTFRAVEEAVKEKYAFSDWEPISWGND